MSEPTVKESWDALQADLARARRIAATLERELAIVRAQNAELRALVTAGLRFVALNVDPGDVVGQEDVPLGDPWGELDGWKND